PRSVINAVAIGSVVLSLLWVLKTLAALGPLETAHIERYFTWFASGGLNVGFDLAVDRLTAVMLLVVTVVGLLIHIYATGYMAHEGGYYRFFAYLNLFMFFMLMLVLGANFLVMFVGWEGVGLCSYLLIGFYFLRKSAADAGKKAFIVNRVGDFGFSLAIFLTVVQFGALDFVRVFSQVNERPVEQGAGVLTAIGLLLLLGATGKSAQIPLYVWLPDAMEGPTPVSALIHAATMVTAGVYMVARCAPIYLHAPIALHTVAVVGLATAVFAATIGLAQNDIKKVFAYSTVSQLGYMFLGLGAGAFSAGIFHLVTHAFFKALLFLSAGSVIHALSGEQDLRNMGGLRKRTPITFWTMFAAAVAIAGVPPFSGFHSKDAILLAAHHHAPWMYWVGVVTAGMTAFYVFRAVFLAFFGDYRGSAHPHESPAVMTVPLAVLAALSLAGGYFNVPRWLEPLFPIAHEQHDQLLVLVSVAAGFAGIGLAYYLYLARPGAADRIAESLGGLYRLVLDKYRVDELYAALIVNPLVNGSRRVLWKGLDAGLIDGAVNGVGAEARSIGGVLRRLQSGYIRNYAIWVVVGALLLVLAAGFGGGAR
ncbi:MAG: NADH-quinone oxidoreductase subunit L, partial [Acidobacteria bacterium]|nr:NADH-quinone oxidoreductase subunit L [Acidobacteriota bacterium]